MVVPIREIRNKLTSFSTNMNPTQNFVLPTVYQDNDTGMNILKEQSPDNYDDVRVDCFLTILTFQETLQCSLQNLP